jgi:hypothetical protein
MSMIDGRSIPYLRFFTDGDEQRNASIGEMSLSGCKVAEFEDFAFPVLGSVGLGTGKEGKFSSSSLCRIS